MEKKGLTTSVRKDEVKHQASAKGGRVQMVAASKRLMTGSLHHEPTLIGYFGLRGYLQITASAR